MRHGSLCLIQKNKWAFLWKAPERRPWGIKTRRSPGAFAGRSKLAFAPLGYWSCLHKHVSYPAAAGRHSIPSRNSAENQPEITVRMLGEKIVARYSTFSWWWPYHRMFVRPDRRRSENYGAGFMTEVAIRLHSGSSIHLPHAKYAIAYCRPSFLCHRI